MQNYMNRKIVEETKSVINSILLDDTIIYILCTQWVKGGIFLRKRDINAH
jgi:hypothetical protein